ncbi:unnamed protein product [Leuciscus chuanchicus]
MSPKKSKVQPKQGEEASQQVGASNMAGEECNVLELPALIRNIMREELNVVVDKLNNLAKDISFCTQRLGEVDVTMSNFDSRVTKLETANEELKGKAERLEMYSRKYNVRVFGLTNDIEKGNPTSYMSALFEDLFQDKLRGEPQVEMARRIGPVGKGAARVMIVRLHKLTTREEIIQIAKKEGVLQVRGMKLRIFPDLTTEMAKKRAGFHEIRSKLKDAGVRHGIIHPATLIITFKGETKKFTERSAAEVYVKTIIDTGLNVRD